MGVHSSADDYTDWDISKQEGVERWVMFADELPEMPDMLNINWV